MIDEPQREDHDEAQEERYEDVATFTHQASTTKGFATASVWQSTSRKSVPRSIPGVMPP
ncbi:hypothetical protein ABI_00230 [Asticcacaulis biprosthecium C19]|uniref:Uncharacterized protein n=1 Tax=Asticcacaulis biprosthecium C19 TaxID=715226 RepID=F4QFY0_9CAUL|nr:hypothetical protein [Asticcacaulis biprosthecium]EGF93791.1 hypothetical protein ABI_00230 [Asticcacaulis biprosthecium C19]